MLERCIYISTATRLYGPEDLDDILRVARTNNLRDRLTGLLLYHDGAILQILEGEPGPLHDCFARIADDERHMDVLKLICDEVETREFGEWRMGFRPFETLSGAQKEGFINLQALAKNSDSALRSKPGEVGTMIESFLAGFRDLARV